MLLPSHFLQEIANLRLSRSFALPAFKGLLKLQESDEPEDVHPGLVKHKQHKTEKEHRANNHNGGSLQLLPAGPRDLVHLGFDGD